MKISKKIRFNRINSVVLLSALCGLATFRTCWADTSQNTQQNAPYRPGTDRIKNLGGKLLLDAYIESTQALQVDKYIDLVGVSSVTIPHTGHVKIYLSSTTHAINGLFDNGTITPFGGITGVTAGNGLLGGGTSGTVTLSVDYSSVTAQGNIFNGNTQLVQTTSLGRISNSIVDASSITKQGNIFNGASQLIKTNGSTQYPALDGSLITNISVSSSTAIPGTQTNNNANPGNLGEYFTSYQSATNAPTSGQWGDLTSIPLTAGDWDINVIGNFVIVGVTTRALIGVGKTAGNNGPDITGQYPDDQADIETQLVGTETALTSGVIPALRVSLSGAASIYLKMFASYTGGPPQFRGRISARRMR